MEYELLLSHQASQLPAPTVLLPSGSLEQHGTEAPLGCDAIVAKHLCLEAGRETGAPVLPVVSYGDSRSHLGFPGTFSLTTRTLAQVYSEILESASRNGFRRCLIISGHGGNRSAAEDACNRDYGALSPRYLGWWQLPGAPERESELFPDSGHHVTSSEVSMVWSLLGETPPGVFTGTYPAWQDVFGDPEAFRQAYPDGGVGGDMSQVSVEKGALLFAHLVDALCRVIREP
ncbi:MAG: creatininase family protein [Candidatus Fermentibacteraceae bacterium]